MSDDNRPGDFSEPMMWPRYTGIPTFMRTPGAETLDEVDVGLVGVPFDGGVTNRTGARHGPRETRSQSSLMRRINQSTRVAPYDLCRVCDVGDALVKSPFHLESSLDEIEQSFSRLHVAGGVPIAAGGDHSITLPIFRAIMNRIPRESLPAFCRVNRSVANRLLAPDPEPGH